MSNMEKVKEMLLNDPGMMEKVREEIRRIAQGGEAVDAKECMIKAVKSILDIDLTGEDLKAFETKPGEISLEELDQVSGGSVVDWFVRNIAAPVQKFCEDRTFRVAQDIMLAGNNEKLAKDSNDYIHNARKRRPIG